MTVRRDSRNAKRWYFRTVVRLSDGTRQRIFGVPGVPGMYEDLPDTKLGAQQAEQRAINEAHALVQGRFLCPRCGAQTRLDADQQIEKHHVPDEVRTFARLPGDAQNIGHFFEYRVVCPLSGAFARLGFRA